MASRSVSSPRPAGAVSRSRSRGVCGHSPAASAGARRAGESSSHRSYFHLRGGGDEPVDHPQLLMFGVWGEAGARHGCTPSVPRWQRRLEIACRCRGKPTPADGKDFHVPRETRRHSLPAPGFVPGSAIQGETVWDNALVPHLSSLPLCTLGPGSETDLASDIHVPGRCPFYASVHILAQLLSQKKPPFHFFSGGLPY